VAHDRAAATGGIFLRLDSAFAEPIMPNWAVAKAMAAAREREGLRTRIEKLDF
jgi:hypothetical protein